MKKNVNFQITETMLDAARKAAHEHYMSLSEYIRGAILHRLENERLDREKGE